MWNDCCERLELEEPDDMVEVWKWEHKETDRFHSTSRSPCRKWRISGEAIKSMCTNSRFLLMRAHFSRISSMSSLVHFVSYLPSCVWMHCRATEGQRMLRVSGLDSLGQWPARCDSGSNFGQGKRVFYEEALSPGNPSGRWLIPMDGGSSASLGSWFSSNANDRMNDFAAITRKGNWE